MTDDFERYAVYWVPRRSDALTRFGFDWTGWCAEEGELRPRSNDYGRIADFASISAHSWRHGLHGVIKAPFRLAEGQSQFALEHQLGCLADENVRVTLPHLQLAVVGGRVALVPKEHCPELSTLVVKICESLMRLDARPVEQFRRKVVNGFTESPADSPLLGAGAYGADRVIQLPASDALRFHIPLTDRLALGEAFDVMEHLRPAIEPMLSAPRWLRDLALMGDPGGGRPFRVLERFELREYPMRPAAHAMPTHGPMMLAPTFSSPMPETDLAS